LKAAHPAENRLLLTKFLRTTELLLPGVATAVRYSEISHALALKGTPIPENDIWIAAAATEFGMPLVTRDAHFKNVAGLEMLAW
jgi:tRNA(fMet)-specific endonuclease VapC